MTNNGFEFAMRFHGVPVYVSETAPLRKTKRIDSDDYEEIEVETDALCMMMDGAVYIHPERLPYLDDLYRTSK